MRASNWMGLAVLAGLGLAPAAHGAALTWQAGMTLNSIWAADGSWTTAGYPNAQDDEAIFKSGNYPGTSSSALTGTYVSANPVVVLPLGGDVRVGKITMTSASGHMVIGRSSTANPESGGPYSIIFDNSSGEATWARANGTSGAFGFDVLSNLVLASDLRLNWDTQRWCAIQGIISDDFDNTGHHSKLTINSTRRNASNAKYHVAILGSSANTYSGGTLLLANSTTTSVQEIVSAEKNGAFGTGDVEVGTDMQLNLTDRGATDDMIADTATLVLDAGSKLYLAPNVNEIVGGLKINGELVAPGTYSCTDFPTYFASTWNNIPSTGTLTVQSSEVPEPASIGVLGLGALLALRRRSRH